MHATTIGLDLAKGVFQVHGVDAHGKVALRKQLKRSQVLAFFANLPSCLVGMEACGGSHHWARELGKLGHATKLMPPQYVKPYIKGSKNDRRDAEAICEAVSRPSMRFVPVKTVEQQDLQALHRVRARLITARTALVNQIRGLLAEFGIVVSLGIGKLRRELPVILENTQGRLTALELELFTDLGEELREADRRVAVYDHKIQRASQSNPLCRRLLTIPGIGPITATALTAAIGDGRAFANGRQLSAWLGLVPGEHSSGGKAVLLGIHKRGDPYLRTMLIHGARALLRYAERRPNEPRNRWLLALSARRGSNVAAVAQANKTARIAWAVLAHDEDYQAAA